MSDIVDHHDKWLAKFNVSLRFLNSVMKKIIAKVLFGFDSYIRIVRLTCQTLSHRRQK